MKRMNLIKKIVATGTVAALSVSMLSATVIAGSFVTSDKGIWYKNDDGTYPASVWKWIDADGDGQYQCYAFDENGYAYVNTTTPDGYTTDAQGAWIKDGVQVVHTALEDISESPIGGSGASANKDKTQEDVLNEVNQKNGVTNETAYGTTTKDVALKAPTATSTGVDSGEIVTNKHTVTRKTAAGTGESSSEPDMSQTSYETYGPSVPADATTSSVAPQTDSSTLDVKGPDGTVDNGTDD